MLKSNYQSCVTLSCHGVVEVKLLLLCMCVTVYTPGEMVKMALSMRSHMEKMTSLYGLFKQATHGPCDVSRPSFYDVMGKMKWYSTLTCASCLISCMSVVLHVI